MVLVPDEGAVQELAAAYHPAPLSAEETVTAEPRVRPAPGPVTARNAREPGHRTRAPQHRTQPAPARHRNAAAAPPGVRDSTLGPPMVAARVRFGGTTNSGA